jgi:D-alanyl-D-alanine carboxypeptidase (penicillin-binding protein 5/6)
VKGRLTAVAAALVLVVVWAAPAHASAPQVDARAYFVMNAANGDVLAASHARESVPIASITKLMTVLVALEHLKLDDVVTVGPGASAVGESTIHLRTGERITVGDLVKGALIQSANDAADALAFAAGGGDTARFVAWMNAKAAALGLRDTHFSRPDGLDAPGHVSSARDVVKLARVAMHVPAVRNTVDERVDTISGGRTLHTWNDLLGVFPGLIGVKTGHTGAAGWCEVAAVRRPGVSVYATILGSPSRDQRNADLAALLRWGVSRYRVESVIAEGRTYALAETGYGRDPLHLVAASRARRAFRVDRPLRARVVAASAVSLPVRAGKRLGTIRVYDGKRLLVTRPLVAARAVSRPSLAARLGFYARRTAEHIWSWVS